MKCVWICNNFGSTRDAIGRYVMKLVNVIQVDYDDVSVEVIHGDTAEKNRIQKILSLTMTNAIIKARKRIQAGDIDIVCLEYPFIEWNPLIMPAFQALCTEAKKKNCKIAISVHEYLRSGKARRFVVKNLIKNADFAFVTDMANKKALEPYAKCYLRSIPSPLSIGEFDVDTKILDRTFLYIGLINKSKAFFEMIEAFSRFNTNEKARLDIYSSSKLDLADGNGIFIHKNAPDEELEQALRNSTYCILPSLPDITLCNGTLKIAAEAGCTIIGRFAEGLHTQLPFGLHVEDYSISSFKAGIQKAFELSEERLCENAKRGNDFGKRFSHKKTANEMINVFRTEIEKKR